MGTGPLAHNLVHSIRGHKYLIIQIKLPDIILPFIYHLPSPFLGWSHWKQYLHLTDKLLHKVMGLEGDYAMDSIPWFGRKNAWRGYLTAKSNCSLFQIKGNLSRMNLNAVSALIIAWISLVILKNLPFYFHWVAWPPGIVYSIQSFWTSVVRTLSGYYFFFCFQVWLGSCIREYGPKGQTLRLPFLSVTP